MLKCKSIGTVDLHGNALWACGWVREKSTNGPRPLLPTDDTRRCKLSYESTVTIDLHVRYKALLSP